MCDTFVALGNSTLDGSVIFAKNSDREPNEAHQIVLIPASDHLPGSMVKCTYIDVPQVEHTYAVLLARPFWIWGAEMGTNEHGVVIGNEAVFTKAPMEKKAGLIGMDFIRLALERSRTAEEALYGIIELLETYGQGGNCGFQHPMYYHNSYIIADQTDAWVLETAEKNWAAEKVVDIRSISNALTIGATWDMASTDLVSYAIDRGWCKRKADFHFANCYSDTLYTPLSDAHRRQTCSTELLKQKKGHITVKTMMSVLRSHALEDPGGNYRPDKGITGSSVCMHAGFGPVRGSQSVGSMISHLAAGEPVHWLTGTSAPCTSVFKPVWIEAGLPDIGPAPDGTYDQATLFWRHELLHRDLLRNYRKGMDVIQAERDSLEDEFIQQSASLRERNADQRLLYSQSCFSQAELAEKAWLAQILQISKTPTQLLYSIAWRQFNRTARIPGA